MDVRLLRRIAALLLLPAVAGAAPETDEPAKQRYAIELVIFRQYEASGADAEQWPRPPVPLSEDLRVRHGTDEEPFRALPAQQREFAGILERLEQADQYEVLAHVGWVQPGLSAEQAPWLAVGNDPAPGEEARGLYGMLRVYASRYLHVQTQLRLQREPEGVIYPMEQRRRMRSGEIHYLDHPVLGVVVQAREYEPAQDEDADSTDAEGSAQGQG